MKYVTTGLTEGDFHRLGVLSNGTMTDILTLIGAGGGTVTSATLPLSIANGVLSIDLSSYSDTVAVNTLLANKIDTVTVAAPLTVSGAGASRALTTLWKPSTVSVGAGLFSLASDVNGTRSLSLTGTEESNSAKIARCQQCYTGFDKQHVRRPLVGYC